MTELERKTAFEEIIKGDVKVDDAQFHFDDWMKGLKIASALRFAEMYGVETKMEQK